VLGVTPTTVARWDRGDRPITSPALVRLALERIESRPQVRVSSPSRGGGRHHDKGLSVVPFPPRGDPWHSSDGGGPHSLPAALTSFIGREREKAARRLYRADHDVQSPERRRRRLEPAEVELLAHRTTRYNVSKNGTWCGGFIHWSRSWRTSAGGGARWLMTSKRCAPVSCASTAGIATRNRSGKPTTAVAGPLWTKASIDPVCDLICYRLRDG
jgi:hypothetical protein